MQCSSAYVPCAVQQAAIQAFPCLLIHCLCTDCRCAAEGLGFSALLLPKGPGVAARRSSGLVLQLDPGDQTPDLQTWSRRPLRWLRCGVSTGAVHIGQGVGSARLVSRRRSLSFNHKSGVQPAASNSCWLRPSSCVFRKSSAHPGPGLFSLLSMAFRPVCPFSSHPDINKAFWFVFALRQVNNAMLNSDWISTAIYHENNVAHYRSNVFAVAYLLKQTEIV